MISLFHSCYAEVISKDFKITIVFNELHSSFLLQPEGSSSPTYFLLIKIRVIRNNQIDIQSFLCQKKKTNQKGSTINDGLIVFMRMELYKYVNNRNLYISYEYVCRFISQFKEVMIMSTSMFHFSSTHRKILSVSEHFGTLPRMKYPSKHFLFSKTSSA